MCGQTARPPPAGEGVAGSPVELVEHDGLAAFVSRVPVAEFGEEPLRRNLNELAWLERVARAHEAVLERALADASIAPLRLCTIYDGPARVRMMLGAARARFLEVLDLLDGRQEWGVKLLARPGSGCRGGTPARSRTPRRKRRRSPSAARVPATCCGADLSAQVADAADALATEVAEEVHANLLGWPSPRVTRPAQNRELSGYEGDMALNAAYLVEAKRVDGLRELVADARGASQPSRCADRAHRALAAVQLRPARRRGGAGVSAVSERDVALVDLVDRLLAGGVVIAGDLTLAVADVDLVYVQLRALITSVATAEEKGLLPPIGSAL